MGAELANSAAFAQCQVEKVFATVCLRKPADASDRSLVSQAVARFADSGYQLRQVFVDTATYCSAGLAP